MIKKMDWDSVGGILHKGGTKIGTARCLEFREKSGRLKAAKNLIDRQIDNLVVIGGDGSLTGANLFREEWPLLLAELVKTDDITKEQAKKHPRLNIVGLSMCSHREITHKAIISLNIEVIPGEVIKSPFFVIGKLPLRCE